MGEGGVQAVSLTVGKGTLQAQVVSRHNVCMCVWGGGSSGQKRHSEHSTVKLYWEQRCSW
jgi:hypothetical protein